MEDQVWLAVRVATLIGRKFHVSIPGVDDLLAQPLLPRSRVASDIVPTATATATAPTPASCSGTAARVRRGR
ncbi:hypothetical protein ACFW93_41255 [Streptomyces canus]|uniref:hypothetical protein n=1 Tax=Streptomyces canus TaxID=58343 RepID=UPI003676ADAA